MNLDDALKSIESTNENYAKESKLRWDGIAKPLNSLGLLEKAITKIISITECKKVNLNKKALVIMCSDNGVVEEGVTQTGSEVTAIVTKNFTKEETSVAIMCKDAGVHIFPVDIGVESDIEDSLNRNEEIVPFKVLNRKVAYGTKNMLKEDAMTREECVEAIEEGINLVSELKKKGYNLIATGEMGIANTTTSSAVASILLNKEVEEVTGRGAGLTTKGLERKVEVIKKSIKLRNINKNDVIDVLSKVGGFDIAGLTGVFIGGALYKVPVIIDGFISGIAALIAVRLNPLVKEYLLPSHVSKEPAGLMLLKELDLKPLLTCEMCLGEGTGAILSIPILEMAASIYNNMSTFQDINVEEYKPLD